MFSNCLEDGLLTSIVLMLLDTCEPFNQTTLTSEDFALHCLHDLQIQCRSFLTGNRIAFRFYLFTIKMSVFKYEEKESLDLARL